MEVKQTLVSNGVKVSVVVGIFLVGLFNAIPWMLANWNAYILSYYYAEGGGSLVGDITWLLSTNMVVHSLGIFVGSSIVDRLGIRASLFISIVLLNGGVMLSYLCIKLSFVYLCISFGVIVGFSSGVVSTCQLILVVRWIKTYQGTVTALMSSSSIMGAVAMNWLLTLYVNPQDEIADRTIGGVKLFSQPDLVDRIPYTFVHFGMLSLTVNLVGFVLIRAKPGTGTVFTDCYGRLSNRLSRQAAATHTAPELRNDGNCLPEQESQTEMDTLIPEMQITPRKALKTKAFYAIWMVFITHCVSFFVLNNYVKIFGLIYIPDDHFLTAVMMVKCFLTPVASLFAGLAFDKLGAKNTMLAMSSVLCILSSFIYLSAIIDKWLYLFSCTVYGCMASSLYCLAVSCCARYFGESHFTQIFGMISYSCWFSVLVLPPFTNWVISNYGWLVLFDSVTVVAFLNIILLIVLLPQTTRRS